MKTTKQITPKVSIDNIVLVHIAWADGSSWSRSLLLLLAKALNVVSNIACFRCRKMSQPQKDRKHAGGAVLLVGHSQSGAVITVAGDYPRVAGLV